MASSKYFVGSVACTESELPYVQTMLQTFPAAKGAVTHDAGKARYCIDLENLSSEDATALIEKVRNTINIVLEQVRAGQ